jgi:predicted transcriptional regulator
MEVNLSEEIRARLQQLEVATGRTPDDLVADAMAGYLDELSRTHEMLDRRYDSIRAGEVALIDGEEALKILKERTDAQRRRA